MRARDWSGPLWWGTLAACLAPLALLAWWFGTDQLTADPVTRGIRTLGEWGLRFLVIGLALTPLRRLTGWSWPMRLRRLIGVTAICYVGLHLLAYVLVDKGLDWSAIGRDIVKRPYITAGVAAFLLLVPLAATSTNGMIRRLGGRRWRRLHRLAYLAAPLAVLHYDLLVKADASFPLLYAAVVAVLLAERLLAAARKRWAPASPLRLPGGLPRPATPLERS